MSTRYDHRCTKKRSHESLGVNKDQRRNNLFTKYEVESRSSSCGSKRSNKKLLKNHQSQVNHFFNVEKIVGSKVKDGKPFYKVRWQGYDESEDSWEPEENLMNIYDLIEEFLANKDEGPENGRSISCQRTRRVGGYEYLLSHEIVATKTKYFDDVRDGKIDLTKNDLYSRVKTRKRHQSDTVEDVEQMKQESTEEPITDSARSSFSGKNKYYESNLFEITAEFMKNNNFDQCLTTQAYKCSTNDDLSSFNCSISPHTNHSDDLMPQISPDQLLISDCFKKSTATQTEYPNNVDKTPMIVDANETIKPHLQKIICQINDSLQRKCPRERLVTSETHLLSIYTKEIKLSKKSAVVVPHLYSESDLVSIDTIDDLKKAIILGKYNLLQSAFQNGVTFDLNRLFIPENITPLHLAVSKNRFNIVRLLLQNGASPDDCHVTPLMMASSGDYLHVMKALLEYGASTDRRDQNGKNALGYALDNGRISAVKMLLENGTNFFKVIEQQSAASLVNDLLTSNRMSQTTGLSILSLISSYHLSFITALNRTVSQYLSRQMTTQSSLIFPYQWIGVLDRDSHIDFLLDDSVMVNLDTPILLLVHGIQADSNFEFWLDNNCCCIDSVFVNGQRQSSLSTANFVTTLWPLYANNNRLTVNFTDHALLTQEEEHIRVAIVAICTTSCDTNNLNKAHSR